MKLCVIGAGAAGLISIKRGLEFGCDVTAFELSDKVGGLWNYTDQVGKDKFGVDIHTSMYQGLFTNLPIEIMSYPDHPFREQKESFVPFGEVLGYYEAFAAKYDLKNYVKFEHQVIRVRPEDDGWEVMVRNLPEDSYSTYHFDAVLVCSGHFHSSFIPLNEGHELFQGQKIHSHDYRKPEPLAGRNVLVVGGSYSGVDIVYESSKFAKHVTWSHHLADKPSSSYFRENVEQKPDVAKLTVDGAMFVDGSFHEFDVIIYCTGYEYKFPFLSVDCGISTEEGFVKPLYMHCLSVNHPTLGIIGLANLICPNPLFDLQARFCLTFMTGKMELPSKDERMKEFESDIESQAHRGYTGKKVHYLGEGVQDKYYVQLAQKASIEPIMPCIAKMHSQCLVNRKADFVNFRKVKFHVIDDYNFEMSRIY